MDRKTIVRVARMYYEEDMTQQQIAELMGLSRATILSMLKKARAEGIVSIRVVEDETDRDKALESELTKRFDLEHAVVVRCIPGPEGFIRRQVGAAGARFLEGLLQDGDTLACSWGRTLWELAQLIRPGRRRIDVVQICGGLGSIFHENSPNELARYFAQVFGGSYYYLHAPGIVESKVIRDALLSDGTIRDTLSRACSATVAACGIGSLDNSYLVEIGTLKEAQVAEYRQSGVVGDICIRFFGADGRLIPTDLDDRIIGPTLGEMSSIKCVVGIAGGLSKQQAIKGALRTGVLNAIVTDSESAEFALSV